MFWQQGQGEISIKLNILFLKVFIEQISSSDCDQMTSKFENGCDHDKQRHPSLWPNLSKSLCSIWELKFVFQ